LFEKRSKDTDSDCVNLRLWKENDRAPEGLVSGRGGPSPRKKRPKSQKKEAQVLDLEERGPSPRRKRPRS